MEGIALSNPEHMSMLSEEDSLVEGIYHEQSIISGTYLVSKTQKDQTWSSLDQPYTAQTEYLP